MTGAPTEQLLRWYLGAEVGEVGVEIPERGVAQLRQEIRQADPKRLHEKLNETDLALRDGDRVPIAIHRDGQSKIALGVTLRSRVARAVRYGAVCVSIRVASAVRYGAARFASVVGYA